MVDRAFARRLHRLGQYSVCAIQSQISVLKQHWKAVMPCGTDLDFDHVTGGMNS
jgi:hypothetical protein